MRPYKESIAISDEARKEYLLSLPPLKLAKELAQTGESLIKEERVPVDEIRKEEVINEAHALAMGQTIMHGQWGQTQPLLICAFLSADGTKLVRDTLDGYHRLHGIEIVCKRDDIKPPLIKTNTMFGLTRAEILEQKIMAATAIKSIKFARIANWMQEVWGETPWVELMTVSKAFSLTFSDSSGRNLVGNEEMTETIKLWIRNMTAKYGGDIGTLAQQLRIVESANPDLVRLVRIGGSFEKGRMSLTLNAFEAIVMKFPGESNWDLQAEIANLAEKESLSNVQLRLLLAELKHKKTLDQNVLKTVFDHGGWRTGEVSNSAAAYQPGQLLGPVGALERKVRFSSLSVTSRRLVIANLDQVRLIIDTESDTTPEFSMTLVREWFENGRKLSSLVNDPEKAKEFAKSARRPKRPQEQYAVAKLLISYVFEDEVVYRDGATRCFEQFFLEDLSSKHIEKLLQTFSGHLTELRASKPGQEKITDTLETLMETLASMSIVKEKAPLKWRELLDNLREVSALADEDCQRAVEQFIKDHTVSQPIRLRMTNS